MLTRFFVDIPKRFCRKGKVGSYREDMNDSWIKRIDDWSTERLKRTGLELSG